MPRGRRSGDPESRDRIRQAARNRLLAQGYAGTTLRAGAADAGVDVALISYYFGSERGLFSAVMAPVVSPPTVLGAALHGDVVRLPERLVAAVTAAWDDPVSEGPCAPWSPRPFSQELRSIGPTDRQRPPRPGAASRP